MPRKPKKTSGGKKGVEAFTHAGEAKRKNIPTAETQSFLSEEEAAPGQMRYPRNPDLDPQLVWRGKDEEDGRDLVVDTVPIYIQEKIHPRVLIEDIKRRSGELRAERREKGDGSAGEQFAMEAFWSDFNGLDDPEAAFEFYEHEKNWTNRMILGDSLLVMNSLAEKEALKGQVQMIYFDPPYGIKFNSNWQVSTKSQALTDGKRSDVSRDPEVVKAFRDTWSQGIHSYLAYLRDRLRVAKSLLTNSGSLFVQIGDENNHVVRSLMDETFGSDNFISQITLSKTTGGTAIYLPGVSDFILWYAKNRNEMKYRGLYLQKRVGETGATKFSHLETSDGLRRPMTREEKDKWESIPEGCKVFMFGDFTSQRQGRPSGPGSAMYFPIEHNGRKFLPSTNRGWTLREEGIVRTIRSNRVAVQGKNLCVVRYLDDFPVYPFNNVWMDVGGIMSRTDPKVYVVQTSTTAITR